MDSELPQRLIKARSGHGWSQADLAEVSGVAAAQISRYEQGRSKPRTEVTAKLAKALAVRFEWLAYGDGSPDAGDLVPEHPKSRKEFIALELTDEQYARIQRFAQSRGITYEMAIHTLMGELLKMADAVELGQAEDPASSPKS
ncbi:XRE family transcriptional regulator [Delftia tsuruhatensis]|uniref:helix-turn-helix transcriptional regulator n=1 Tax=Delftia TaxID=80865 RepID=UPI0005528F41|nr:MULTISPECIES: helix-turn-helix transcriptional regulator [Delftia]TDF26198.1 XRE family transcriptional regulator [Delftia tsuruhatensis]